MPSPHLFQLAIDFFGVKPERALYVGDNPMRDIAGAKALGMGAAWIKNERRPLTPEIPKPDLVIADLIELAGVRSKRGDG